MRNEINDATMKIRLELDFKLIFTSQTNDSRLMTGNILAAFCFVKTGIVQELCN